jgi:hypothetical protein
VLAVDSRQHNAARITQTALRDVFQIDFVIMVSGAWHLSTPAKQRGKIVSSIRGSVLRKKTSTLNW